MLIRDRIKELRRVRAAELKPNPRNWRTHPARQQDVLRGLLAEIGYADALLARELDDGTLELIDGHLRAETTPDSQVPVLVLDLDAAEAAKLLATLDPLAGLAGTDRALLKSLVSDISTEHAAVQGLLEELTGKQPELESPEPVDLQLDPMFQLVVECPDENTQRELYERLHGEGFKCRVMSL